MVTIQPSERLLASARRFSRRNLVEAIITADGRELVVVRPANSPSADTGSILWVTKRSGLLAHFLPKLKTNLLCQGIISYFYRGSSWHIQLFEAGVGMKGQKSLLHQFEIGQKFIWTGEKLLPVNHRA